MAVITGATVDFTDYSAPGTPRILNIPDVWGDVTVQDVWDTLSEIESDLENLIYKKLIDRPKGGGKGVLSTSKSVGITLMQNNVQIKFPDQAGPGWVIKRVVDGNAVAQDHLEVEMEALANSDFTNWKNEADVSAAIVDSGGGGFTTIDRATLNSIDTRTDYQNKIINNEREVRKIGANWYLIVFDDGQSWGGAEILRKYLTDKDDADITDLVIGAMAKELANSV